MSRRAKSAGPNDSTQNDERCSPTELEDRIGYRFGDAALRDLALVHSSLGGESDAIDNETLEFLGDAALDLVISELMMREHPEYDEGDLTRLRAGLVNSTHLADIARRYDLGDYLRLGKGEQRSGGDDKDSILSSCYEALIGAIFQDGGYEACRDVVAEHFGDDIREPERTTTDHKTELQELTQKHYKTTPSYRVARVSGPDHDRHYRVELLLEDELLAEGEGRSRKQAEQDAAARARIELEARHDGDDTGDYSEGDDAADADADSERDGT